MIDQAMQDRELVLAIQSVLDCTEWSADTLDTIAELLRSYGYQVRDPSCGP